MLEVKNLVVKYPDGNEAVKNVSLEIKEGERIALLGANGAGKSTLMLSLVGISPIASGEIKINGLDVNKKSLSKIRELVGVVFQNPDDQIIMARVFEDIAFGPRNLGKTEEEVNLIVEKVIKELNIEHLENRVPNKLSGGEKRLVAIGGVLAMEPKLMLFDEPTSFLDSKAKRNLVPVINEINCTKIIATHNMYLAGELCDRAIVMKKGEIAFDGDVKSLITNNQLLEELGL